MNSATPPSEVRSLRTLLSGEHARLEKVFDDLLAAVAANATAEAAKLWSEFDARLLAHLELEEQHILPLFARAHPTEAARIHEEHAQIRSALLKLGVGVDLHLARAEVISHFVELLRTHAAREDKLMYAWSEEHLDPKLRATLLERLFARVTSMPAQ